MTKLLDTPEWKLRRRQSDPFSDFLTKPDSALAAASNADWHDLGSVADLIPLARWGVLDCTAAGNGDDTGIATPSCIQIAEDENGAEGQALFAPTGDAWMVGFAAAAGLAATAGAVPTGLFSGFVPNTDLQNAIVVYKPANSNLLSVAAIRDNTLDNIGTSFDLDQVVKQAGDQLQVTVEIQPVNPREAEAIVIVNTIQLKSEHATAGQQKLMMKIPKPFGAPDPLSFFAAAHRDTAPTDIALDSLGASHLRGDTHFTDPPIMF